jgi:hypothetical protein
MQLGDKDGIGPPENWATVWFLRLVVQLEEGVSRQAVANLLQRHMLCILFSHAHFDLYEVDVLSCNHARETGEHFKIVTFGVDFQQRDMTDVVFPAEIVPANGPHLFHRYISGAHVDDPVCRGAAARRDESLSRPAAQSARMAVNRTPAVDTLHESGKARADRLKSMDYG